MAQKKKKKDQTKKRKLQLKSQARRTKIFVQSAKWVERHGSKNAEYQTQDALNRIKLTRDSNKGKGRKP